MQSRIESDPIKIRTMNLLNAIGIGFQIGVVGDTAFQFLKGLSSASSSPKGVSGFHRLAGACKNVRIRPYASIPGLIGGAFALPRANDDHWMRELQNIREERKQHMEDISRKNATFKDWFCVTAALPTGLFFELGLAWGLAQALDFSSFPRALRINLLHPFKMLRVSGKFSAWSFLSSTLTYAFCGDFDDGKERNNFIADVVAPAVAAGLLSVRRGLPDAAKLAGLVGGVGFMIHYLILFSNDDQAGSKKYAEHVDYNIQDINETQEVAKTDKNMVEAQEDW